MNDTATSDGEAISIAASRRPWQFNGWVHLPILIVVAISVMISFWVANRADSLTYDSVIFIRYARQLSQAELWTGTVPSAEEWRYWVIRNSPVLSVLYHENQHPGFALLILLVRSALAPVLPADSVEAWSLCAQLAAIIGLAILLLAVNRLGTELIDWRAGLAGAAIIGLSPPVIRVASDGLSDMPAMAFLTLSAVYFCRFLRNGRTLNAFVGASFAGLGYLIRPEAVQLALAVSTLLLFRFLFRLGASRGRSALQGLAIILPLVLLVVPYAYVVKGSPLTKKAYLIELAKHRHRADRGDNDIPSSKRALASAEVMHRAKGSKMETASGREIIPRPTVTLGNYGKGILAYFGLWSSLLAYAFVVPLVVSPLSGAIRFRRPDHQLVLAAAALNAFGLPLVLYCLCGYLDIRHVLPALCITTPWVWSGLLYMCELTRNIASAAWRAVKECDIRWPVSAPVATGVFLALMLVPIGFVGASQRLNSQVRGLREMGAWLDDNLPEKTLIVDPCFLTSFYAHLEEYNRWPYVGNLTLRTLSDVLDHSMEVEYLILSDRSIFESMGMERAPLHFGKWVLEEIHSLPVCEGNRWPEQVRVFRIQRASDERLAEENQAPRH